MGKIQVSTGKLNTTPNTTTVWEHIINLESNGVPNLSTELAGVKSQLADIAAQNYLMPVGFRDLSYSQRNSNTNQTGTFRLRIFPQFTSQDWKISFSNVYRNGGNAIVANPNPITIKASIEYNSTIYPIFFGGQRTFTLAPGATIESDIIGLVIKSTDIVYIRTYVDAGSGGYTPLCKLYNNNNCPGDGISYGVDNTDSGTVSSVVNVVGYTPSLIMGYTKNQKPAVLLVGDSIMDGTGDNLTTGTGFGARAMMANKIGYHKISCGGDTVGNFVAWLPYRAPFTKNHRYVICNYGINDITSGTILSTIKTNLLALWAYYANKGLKVYQATILPNTTSTDNWLTLTNQTVGTNESVRLALNVWLRDSTTNGAISQSGGSLLGIFDTAQLVENNGKWNVYGTPIYTGTVTSATVNTLTDSNLTQYPVHTLDGDVAISITGGTGAGQIRSITQNSPANTLYVSSNWTTIPDATSTFSIYRVPTTDGTHPSATTATTLSNAVDISKLV